MLKNKRALESLLSKMNLEHILHITSLTRPEFWSTKGTALMWQCIVTLIWLRFEGKLRGRAPGMGQRLFWVQDYQWLKEMIAAFMQFTSYWSEPSNTNTFQLVVSVCKGIKTGSRDGNGSRTGHFRIGQGKQLECVAIWAVTWIQYKGKWLVWTAGVGGIDMFKEKLMGQCVYKVAR